MFRIAKAVAEADKIYDSDAIFKSRAGIFELMSNLGLCLIHHSMNAGIHLGNYLPVCASRGLMKEYLMLLKMLPSYSKWWWNGI